MVVIRLSRTGNKKAPFYHLVVADQRKPRDGRYIERVGYYNPEARGQATRLELNDDRISHWIKQGAQPSPRVTTLLKNNAKLAGKPAEAVPTRAEVKKEQAKVQEAAAAKKAEAEAKAAAEAKAEEEKAEKAAAEAEAPKEEAKADAEAEAPKEDAADKE